MRIAFHGATSMTSDLPTDVVATSKAGFEALEVWAGKLDSYLCNYSLAKLSSLFKDAGVKPTAINSIEFVGFQGSDYQKIQSRCLELSKIAQAIDCSTLVVVPGPIPYSHNYPKSDIFFPWPNVVKEYVAVLKDLGRIAEPYGVNLAFEFIGFAL